MHEEIREYWLNRGYEIHCEESSKITQWWAETEKETIYIAVQFFNDVKYYYFTKMPKKFSEREALSRVRLLSFI